jgi:glycosyltransferase involved in cell wall biosynthesis
VPTQFTIAIPTHDRRETALLAARSALGQTRPPEQVLVLCDGCGDGTAEALRALGSSRLEALELPKAPGYGYEHRNRSLELARGEAILWLADDDLLTPDHLERIGELWDTGRFDLVQSHGVVVHPDDTLEWFGSDWSLPVNRARLASFNSNPMSSVSLRVDVARAVGGWDVGVQRAADWDLWQRALAASARSARSPEPTVLHFRASGREQAWPVRVRQNAAWLAQLEDPQRVLELRIRLRRAGAQGEADTQQHASKMEQHAATLQQALDATRQELLAAQEHAAQLGAHCAAAESEAAQVAATLRRIYDGGWWRLRRRVLPLMRLVGRGG